MYKCIKFNFDANKLPPFYFLGGAKEGVDHVFFITEKNPSNDYLLTGVGLSVSDNIEDAVLFETKSELESYLVSIWDNFISGDKPTEITAQEKATLIWAVKESLEREYK